MIALAATLTTFITIDLVYVPWLPSLTTSCTRDLHSSDSIVTVGSVCYDCSVDDSIDSRIVCDSHHHRPPVCLTTVHTHPAIPTTYPHQTRECCNPQTSSYNQHHIAVCNELRQVGERDVYLREYDRIALRKGMTPTFGDRGHTIFNTFKTPTAMPNYGICERYRRVEVRKNCAFDPASVSFSNDRDTFMYGHFQSWVYFKESFGQIRQEYHFNNDIMNEAIDAIHSTVSNLTSRDDNITYVTVHVRRSDIVEDWRLRDYGYTSPSVNYYRKAMSWYRSRYKPVVFVVCSDRIRWARDNLASPDVVFIDGHSDVVDMAVLSLGNHTIMSVGTFGWWGSFLAGGETIAYATPAREDSAYRSEFSSDYSDYFLPHWTLMDDD